MIVVISKTGAAWVAAAICSLSLLLACPARADVRSVAVDDPADATPTVSGAPSNPDVARVVGNYDSDGGISITVEFRYSPDQADRSAYFAFYGSFGFGGPLNSNDATTGCSAEITARHHVFHAYRSIYFDRAYVSGYDGYVELTRTTSPDGRTITVAGSAPGFANRDIRCMTYSLYGAQRSSASNLNSNYDTGCDCWYVNKLVDTTGEQANAGPEGVIWFPGRKPVAPPPPPPPPPPPSSTPSPPQSGESTPIPRLTTKDAKMYAVNAIGQRFGKRSIKRSATCRSVDRTSARCKVSWRTGKYSYRGTARIWNSLKKGEVSWNYAFDVTRTDAKRRKKRIVVK